MLDTSLATDNPLNFKIKSSMMSKAKLKSTLGKRLKRLTPKQMLQRLQTVLGQVEQGNASEILLNKICQIIYSLYGEKKLYNYDTTI